jgi:hypothetical protein
MSSLAEKVKNEFDSLNNRINKLETALAPFVEFINKFDQKPIRCDDEFYAIHVGTEWEASLKLSDLRAAREALGPVAALDEPVKQQMTFNVDGEECPVFNCDLGTNFITNSKLTGSPHITECAAEARSKGYRFMSFNETIYCVDAIGEPSRVS